MSIPFLPIHPHPNGLMRKTNRRRLRRPQAGATASQGGPDFVPPEDQFRMSLDIRNQPLLEALLRAEANGSQVAPVAVMDPQITG
jgi:hypothetical protein